MSETTTGRVAPMRLAYLTTEYPVVSHTFVRREIIGLEEAGHEVVRLAIRDAAGRIADEADRREHERTFHCLKQSVGRLALDTLAVALRHPVRWARGVACALRLARPSERGVLRHLAYIVEATCLLREVRRRGAQHLHVHFGTNATSVASIMRAMGGPTYSFTVHGPGEFDAPRGHALGEKAAAAAFVVAITDYCSAQLRRWVAWPHWDRIHVVHCTISDAFLEAAAPIPAASNTLVCVGRLTPQKGQLLLLDAVRALTDEGADLRLVLAGDGELRSVLEQRIDALDLSDQVTITGWIGEAEVRAHLLAARGLVLPSFAEGLPVVIMEAMALGRPVISTRITGIPELVVDGENGWLVPPANLGALVQAMREMLAAPVERLDAMGAAGRVAVAARHRVASEVRTLERLFAGATGAAIESASPAQPAPHDAPEAKGATDKAKPLHCAPR